MKQHCNTGGEVKRGGAWRGREYLFMTGLGDSGVTSTKAWVLVVYQRLQKEKEKFDQ